MGERNENGQAAPVSVSAQDAINYLANYALRSPINPEERQTIVNFRGGLLKMFAPAPATAAIDERFTEAAKAAEDARK